LACALLGRRDMTTSANQAIPFDGSRDGARAGSAALVGTSATVRGFKHALPSLAHADVPLIIAGEPGTGKCEWARAVHLHSGRAARAFHVVQMATMAEGRVERRLFGEPGREGVLAQGRGSTVYLGGIETLSPALQHRLTQWLATESAGSVRVIAGSRVPLEAQVRLGRFSRALFQRLALVQLTIAPLRERIDDVAAIVEDHLWHASAESDESPLTIRESALGELVAYAWPQNVRELVLALMRMRLETHTGTITAELVRKTLRNNVDRTPFFDVLPLERIETDYIVAALALCDGNQTLAARRLGIGRSTLLRKLKAGGPPRNGTA